MSTVLSHVKIVKTDDKNDNIDLSLVFTVFFNQYIILPILINTNFFNLFIFD